MSPAPEDWLDASLRRRSRLATFARPGRLVPKVTWRGDWMAHDDYRSLAAQFVGHDYSLALTILRQI